MEQVHSSQILRLTLNDAGKDILASGCDGVIFSPHLKVAAGVRTADCLSIFAYTEKGLIGAIHAGWRSIARGIGSRFLEMAADCGIKRGDIFFRAGPAICPSCYEVGTDVLEKFPCRAAEAGRLNLLKAFSIQVQAAGADPKKIKPALNEKSCTAENDCFFSHRRGDGSRMLAFAIQH